MRNDAKVTASYFWHLDGARAIRVLRQKQSCVWIRKCSPLMGCSETENRLLDCRKTLKLSQSITSLMKWLFHHTSSDCFSKLSAYVTAKKRLQRYFCLSLSSLHSYKNFRKKWGCIQWNSWNLFDEPCCSQLHRLPRTDAPSELLQMAENMRGHNAACGGTENHLGVREEAPEHFLFYWNISLTHDAWQGS